MLRCMAPLAAIAMIGLLGGCGGDSQKSRGSTAGQPTASTTSVSSSADVPTAEQLLSLDGRMGPVGEYQQFITELGPVCKQPIADVLRQVVASGDRISKANTKLKAVRGGTMSHVVVMFRQAGSPAGQFDCLSEINDWEILTAG